MYIYTIKDSKANELTTMIANAKAAVREQYLDEG